MARELSRGGQEFPADNSKPIPFIPSCRGWSKGTRTRTFPAPFPSGQGGEEEPFSRSFPDGFLCPTEEGLAGFDPLWWQVEFWGCEDHPGSVPFPNGRKFGFQPLGISTLEQQNFQILERREMGRERSCSDISPCSSHESFGISPTWL